MSKDIAYDLRKIADSSRRPTGEDIPLGVQLREAANTLDNRERIISAMTLWLEANQPDVFKRGLWDTINLATPLSAKEEAA